MFFSQLGFTFEKTLTLYFRAYTIMALDIFLSYLWISITSRESSGVSHVAFSTLLDSGLYLSSLKQRRSCLSTRSFIIWELLWIIPKNSKVVSPYIHSGFKFRIANPFISSGLWLYTRSFIICKLPCLIEKDSGVFLRCHLDDFNSRVFFLFFRSYMIMSLHIFLYCLWITIRSLEWLWNRFLTVFFVK